MVTEEKFKELEPLPFSKGRVDSNLNIINFTLQKDNSQVTLFPINDPSTVPLPLLKLIHQEFNYIIDEGRTYPHSETMDFDSFIKYWFSNFVAILLQGQFQTIPLLESYDNIFLGIFYIKPNYTGRCSHVCNAGFIIPHLKRNLGLGKELGRKYLIFAPQLDYVYSVFNLVFETNTASLRIWDSLGFDRIGYVKNVAVLKGEDTLVGAIMYGKDLV